MWYSCLEIKDYSVLRVLRYLSSKFIQICTNFFMVAVRKYSIVTSQNYSEALELSFARCCIIIALTVPEIKWLKLVKVRYYGSS